MRRLAALTAVMLVPVMLAGCSISQHTSTTTIGAPPYTIGSGKETADRRTLEPFHEVRVSSGVYVTVAHGSPSATVTLDDNLVSMVKTIQNDGVLSITVEGSLQTHLRLRVEVSTPDVVDALSVDHGSTLDIESVSSPSLAVTVGNGSTVDIGSVHTPSLAVTVGDGSTLHAGGDATMMRLAVLSGSTGDLRNVSAEQATVNVSGGSTAHVKASQSASGSCTGGSSLVLHGKPATQSVSSDTSSNVHVE